MPRRAATHSKKSNASPMLRCRSAQSAASANSFASSETGNFILKGGGWYADLYSSAPAKEKEGIAGNLRRQKKKRPATRNPTRSPQKSPRRRRTPPKTAFRSSTQGRLDRKHPPGARLSRREPGRSGPFEIGRDPPDGVTRLSQHAAPRALQSAIFPWDPSWHRCCSVGKGRRDKR